MKATVMSSVMAAATATVLATTTATESGSGGEAPSAYGYDEWKDFGCDDGLWGDQAPRSALWGVAEAGKASVASCEARCNSEAKCIGVHVLEERVSGSRSWCYPVTYMCNVRNRENQEVPQFATVSTFRVRLDADLVKPKKQEETKKSKPSMEGLITKWKMLAKQEISDKYTKHQGWGCREGSKLSKYFISLDGSIGDGQEDLGKCAELCEGESECVGIAGISEGEDFYCIPVNRECFAAQIPGEDDDRSRYLFYSLNSRDQLRTPKATFTGHDSWRCEEQTRQNTDIPQKALLQEGGMSLSFGACRAMCEAAGDACVGILVQEDNKSTACVPVNAKCKASYKKQYSRTYDPSFAYFSKGA